MLTHLQPWILVQTSNLRNGVLLHCCHSGKPTVKGRFSHLCHRVNNLIILPCYLYIAWRNRLIFLACISGRITEEYSLPDAILLAIFNINQSFKYGTESQKIPKYNLNERPIAEHHRLQQAYNRRVVICSISFGEAPIQTQVTDLTTSRDAQG